RTDPYLRLSTDEESSLGIPEYSAESWVTDENGSFVNETNTEAAATENSDTESEAGTEPDAES
ncbi:MAG: hypothetical protein K2N26_00725, partial [Oscillospiraceae bacterium]|nr:hypothetical protein [Oscillospiraceae bacterium]